MSWIDVLKGAGGLALVVTVVMFLYFCLMGLIIYLNDQEAPDWWPDWIAKIFVNTGSASDATKKYLYLSNVYSPGSNVLSTYSNHTDSQCLTECSNTANCIGVLSMPASNICSTISNVFSPISLTGNNFYVLQGLQPPKMYSTYTSNTFVSMPPMNSMTVTTQFDCASNCSSNVTCTGFVYNSTTNLCNTYSSITTSNITTTTSNFTSYILTASNFAASPY
jgi:hypothetical protein